jgi:hypothetical protein
VLAWKDRSAAATQHVTVVRSTRAESREKREERREKRAESREQRLESREKAQPAPVGP